MREGEGGGGFCSQKNLPNEQLHKKNILLSPKFFITKSRQ